jgi:hypothetical protein
MGNFPSVGWISDSNFAEWEKSSLDVPSRRVVLAKPSTFKPWSNSLPLLPPG